MPVPELKLQHVAPLRRHAGLLPCCLVGALAGILAIPGVASGDRDPVRWPTPVSPALDPAVESFVTDLMSRMSLEQKVGQVIQAELGW